MIQDIELGLIYRSANARPIEKSNVDKLAESIGQIGMINPICVHKVTRHRGTTPFDAYQIIAGHHRYAAALALKWRAVACLVVDMDDLHAELAEIDENLIRCNLTPAQEASAVFRRKFIYEKLHPETKHGGDRKGDQVANSATRFTSDTAEGTGKSERAIQLAAARGEALGDDLNDIAGTSLDKGVELDALAKMAPDDRRKIIDCAKAGDDVSARQSKIDGDVRNRAAQEIAEWIVSRANGNDLDAVKANLFAAGAKNIAIELTNLIGQSIMDRRFS
jgi:hypothetical protein